MTGYGPQGWTISPLEPLVIDTQKFEKVEKKKKPKSHKAESFQDKLHGSLAKLIVNWMPTVFCKMKGGRLDCKAANFSSDALVWDFMSHHSGEQDLF